MYKNLFLSVCATALLTGVNKADIALKEAPTDAAAVTLGSTVAGKTQTAVTELYNTDKAEKAVLNAAKKRATDIDAEAAAVLGKFNKETAKDSHSPFKSNLQTLISNHLQDFISIEAKEDGTVDLDLTEAKFNTFATKETEEYTTLNAYLGVVLKKANEKLAEKKAAATAATATAENEKSTDGKDGTKAATGATATTTADHSAPKGDADATATADAPTKAPVPEQTSTPVPAAEKEETITLTDEEIKEILSNVKFENVKDKHTFNIEKMLEAKKAHKESATQLKATLVNSEEGKDDELSDYGKVAQLLKNIKVGKKKDAEAELLYTLQGLTSEDVVFTASEKELKNYEGETLEGELNSYSAAVKAKDAKENEEAAAKAFAAKLVEEFKLSDEKVLEAAIKQANGVEEVSKFDIDEDFKTAVTEKFEAAKKAANDLVEEIKKGDKDVEAKTTAYDNALEELQTAVEEAKTEAEAVKSVKADLEAKKATLEAAKVDVEGLADGEKKNALTNLNALIEAQLNAIDDALNAEKTLKSDDLKAVPVDLLGADGKFKLDVDAFPKNLDEFLTMKAKATADGEAAWSEIKGLTGDLEIFNGIKTKAGDKIKPVVDGNEYGKVTAKEPAEANKPSLTDFETLKDSLPTVTAQLKALGVLDGAAQKMLSNYNALKHSGLKVDDKEVQADTLSRLALTKMHEALTATLKIGDADAQDIAPLTVINEYLNDTDAKAYPQEALDAIKSRAEQLDTTLSTVKEQKQYVNTLLNTVPSSETTKKDTIAECTSVAEKLNWFNVNRKDKIKLKKSHGSYVKVTSGTETQKTPGAVTVQMIAELNDALKGYETKVKAAIEALNAGRFTANTGEGVDTDADENKAFSTLVDETHTAAEAYVAKLVEVYDLANPDKKINQDEEGTAAADEPAADQPTPAGDDATEAHEAEGAVDEDEESGDEGTPTDDGGASDDEEQQ